MLNLNISYNIEKDAENYLKSVYEFVYPDDGGTSRNFDRSLYPDQQEKIKNSKNKEEAKEVILDILQKWYTKNKSMIELNNNALQKLWENKKEAYLNGVKKIYNKSLDWPEVSVYLTTLTICPYNFNKKWFMVSVRTGIEKQLQTIFHELFHFVFYEHYYSYCKKKLNNEQIHHLKEALTIFLNTKYFSKAISVYDSECARQVELRSFFRREYFADLDHFNFQEFLDRAIEKIELGK